MNTQARGLQPAENDLKRLMADVSRAIEKAQEAIGKISIFSNTAAARADAETTTSSS
jgi:hypothetical protein